MLDAIDEIVIAVNVNTVTEGKKQCKFELGQQLYYACRRYVADNRINTDFDDLFDERKDLFIPHFQLTKVNQQMKQQLLDKYAVNGEGQMIADAKLIEKLWDKFKSIQSFIRNTAHPIYKKQYLDKEQSGTFTDIATLKSIWQTARTEAIINNARKHKYSYVGSEKTRQGADSSWSPLLEQEINSLGATVW